MKFLTSLTPPSPYHVFKSHKLLYGLKKASRKWYANVAGALSLKGFSSSLGVFSLLFKKTGDFIIIVVFYVDDILLTGHHPTELADLKVFLYSKFKIKDLGLVHYFLGMEI